MEQEETVIPIVFISDSKRFGAKLDVASPVQAHADRDDGDGGEEIITFLTLSRPTE